MNEWVWERERCCIFRAAASLISALTSQPSASSAGPSPSRVAIGLNLTVYVHVLTVLYNTACVSGIDRG